MPRNTKIFNKILYKPLKKMDSAKRTGLIKFLKEELAIPAGSIALALRQDEPAPNLLPMILWQYGLITIEQLDKVFDWLEAA